MKVKLYIGFVLTTFIMLSCGSKEKHLFILSGQSNMARLDHTVTFSPHIYKEFGKENVIIVNHAFGGQPIRQWYKDWHKLNGDSTPYQTQLYDQLSRKIKVATNKENIGSVSFLWMQGERDAVEHKSGIYLKSLEGLKTQIENDFDYEDIFMVIGRINDYGFGKENIEKSWIDLRKSQEEFANKNSKVDWINTDDLNSGKSRKGHMYENNIHMSRQGYNILGKRFADKAIDQITKFQQKTKNTQ